MTRYRTIVADPPWDYDGAKGMKGCRGRDFLPYSSMSLAEITALPVGDLAVPGAHIYLWTTNRHLFDCKDILSAWGFRWANWIVWCKEPMGLGGGSDAFSYTTEFCVWGRKRFGKDIKAAREAQCLSQGDVARIVLGDARNRLIQRWEEDDAWPRPDHVQALCSVLGWDETQFAGAPAKRWHSTWFNWKRGRHSAKPEAFLDLVEQTSPGPYLELFARRQRLGWDTWGDQALPHVDLEALKAREGQS